MQFKGHEFKEKSNDRRKFKEACNTFIDEVVTRLSTTFPDNNIMGDFQPLIPKDSRLLSHEEATSKIERLCQHYDAFIYREAAMAEWVILAHVLQRPMHANINMKDCVTHILYPSQDTYPNLSRLAAIGITLPMTSVNCGRGISAYNAIKTRFIKIKWPD